MSKNLEELQKEDKGITSKDETKKDIKSEDNSPQNSEIGKKDNENNILIEKSNDINNNEQIIKKEEDNKNDNLNKEEELNIKNKEEKNININNNENNNEIKKKEGGGFMITELLNINNENKTDNPKNIYLKEKYPEINNNSSIQNAIKIGIKKTHEDIRKKFLENNLTLNNNKLPYDQQLLLLINGKKSNGKNSKLLKILKENEKSLSFNISKLTSQEKMVEGLAIPKEDKVGCNNKNYNLKVIKNNKENLLKKLERVNEQIRELIIKESNSENKEKNIPDYRILDDKQEKYNKYLIEIGKQSNNSSMNYIKKMKSSYDKRQNEIDSKENEMKKEREKYFKEKIDNEKELILKRKKKNDELCKRINKYAHKKTVSQENYIYYKLQEQFEENQKKYINKALIKKKDPVYRKDDFDELAKRVNEQKKLMEIDNEERKKKLLELWLYRSQTLPSYHHPLIKYVEEESKNRKGEWNEIEKKRKECNDLEKRNFKPPKITINKVLRKQIENRKIILNHDNIRKMRQNNKSNRFKFSPIKPFIKKNMENQLSFNEINSSQRKNKKILKPIKILSPTSNKSRDYLKEVLNKTKKAKSPNSKSSIDFNNILEKNNNNIVESLMTAKNQLEKLDDKIKRKKTLLNIKEKYTNDIKLADQVGKLLIDSVQSKINVLSKIVENE